MVVVVKNQPANAGDTRDISSIPGSQRSPGREHVFLPVEFTPVFLPGESPWTEEPGRLQSMGSQRAGQDWATNAHNSACQTFYLGLGFPTIADRHLINPVTPCHCPSLLPPDYGTALHVPRKVGSLSCSHLCVYFYLLLEIHSISCFMLSPFPVVIYFVGLYF